MFKPPADKQVRSDGLKKLLGCW